MNGQSPASKGNTALRQAHKLREFADRIRALENRRNTLTPNWRAGEDDHGNLMFTHLPTGTTHLAATIPNQEATT